MKTECSAADMVAFKARFRESFSYNPETGVLLWTERPREHFKREIEWRRHNMHYAGKPAGTPTFRPDGRRCYDCISFRLNGIKKRFYVHHVAFVLMGVEIPDGYTVDHKDLDVRNNRWSNLRLATHQQQNYNSVQKRKVPLPKGVYARKGKFNARYWFNGKGVTIGTFATAEEAHAAYCKVSEALHGEFFRASK